MAFSKDAWELQRTQLESTTKKGFLFWKPKQEGLYNIRFFLSPNSDNKYPFTLIYVHWVPSGDGTKPIICSELSELGTKTPCPICKKRKELFGSNLIESVALAKQIRPTRAYLQWGFVKEPTSASFDPEPKLIGLAKTPIEQIVDAMTAYDDEDETRPNIFEEKNGKVVIIRKSSDGQYARYTATISGKSLPLNVEPWVTKVNATKDIAETIPMPTEEELNKALDAIEMASSGETIEDGNDDTDNEEATSIASVMGKASGHTASEDDMELVEEDDSSSKDDVEVSPKAKPAGIGAALSALKDDN